MQSNENDLVKVTITVQRGDDVLTRTAEVPDNGSFIGRLGEIYIKFQRCDAGIPGGDDATVEGESDDQADGA